MKMRRRRDIPAAEGDMTPMIDMTFQLIAFFMVLINFTEADVDDRITLPRSELAKPPDQPVGTIITLQLTDEGQVIFAGDLIPVDAVTGRLRIEREIIERKGELVAMATIAIRADAQAKTGDVQKLIRLCQEVGFEKFALRAKQESG